MSERAHKMATALSQQGRIIIESDSLDNPSWRTPTGNPWTVTVVTYNRAFTEDEELGEDEWLRYGGGSMGAALEAALDDVLPPASWNTGHIDGCDWTHGSGNYCTCGRSLIPLASSLLDNEARAFE